MDFINKGQQATAKRMRKQAETEAKQDGEVSSRKNIEDELGNDFLTLIEASSKEGLSQESLYKVFGEHPRALHS